MKISDLTIPLLTAFLFSLFIYLAYFDISNPILELISGLLSIYLILTIGKTELFKTGFFIGVLWFFWIGFSMQYYGFPYLIPIPILGFGLFYGFLFYFLGYYKNLWFRGSFLIIINLIEPFGFNWFKPQIIFVNTSIGTELWQFGLVVLSIIILIQVFQKKRYLLFLPTITILLFTINFAKKSAENILPFKIEVVETKIKQEEKWLKKNRASIINMNLEKIDLAIQNRAELVILPESTFPLFLNHHYDLIETLKERSNKITIWCGGLLSENGNFYNASYIFQNGKYKTAKKVVLVPFGEYIPLPKFIAQFISEIFFNGLQDFTPASQPTDFQIQGTSFRNAICYEATSEELYKNSPKYMIATSNNGWFLPSIEPVLQKLLMQHFSNINGVTIIHSANMAGTGIIYPK